MKYGKKFVKCSITAVALVLSVALIWGFIQEFHAQDTCVTVWAEVRGSFDGEPFESIPITIRECSNPECPLHQLPTNPHEIALIIAVGSGGSPPEIKDIEITHPSGRPVCDECEEYIREQIIEALTKRGYICNLD